MTCQHKPRLASNGEPYTFVTYYEYTDEEWAQKEAERREECARLGIEWTPSAVREPNKFSFGEKGTGFQTHLCIHCNAVYWTPWGGKE